MMLQLLSGWIFWIAAVIGMILVVVGIATISRCGSDQRKHNAVVTCEQQGGKILLSYDLDYRAAGFYCAPGPTQVLEETK
jgi:hypothetical protein